MDQEQERTTKTRVGTFLQMQPSMSGFVSGYTAEDGSCHYSVIFGKTVIYPDVYLEMIHTIRNMRECDTMTILLCTNGGWVETGINIIHAIQQSRGTVITDAIGMCASIGAVIWSCGHIRKISPLGTLMFHMPSGGYFGKCADIASETAEIGVYFKDLLSKITQGILTPENISDIVDHRKDVYLPGPVVQARLKALEAKTAVAPTKEVSHEA